MSYYVFEHETEQGIFLISFEMEPYRPARINCSAEDSCPAEGGTPEDVTIRRKGDSREIPQEQWQSEGLDPKDVDALCVEHVADVGEAIRERRTDDEIELRRERRHFNEEM